MGQGEIPMDHEDFKTVDVVKAPTRHARLVRRWLTSTAIVAGGITIGGLAFTHGGSTPAAASASPASGTVIGTADLANSTVTGTLKGPKGFGGRLGGRGFGGGLTVTGVSGTTITATNQAGATVTITVSGTTT